jgi:hypothetical protein
MFMSELNPYAPPHDDPGSADSTGSTDDGQFIPNGRPVPAGNGYAWLKHGYEFFRKSISTWIGVAILFILLFGGLSLVLSKVPYMGHLAGLIYPVLLAGLMIGCDEVRKGRSLEIGTLFAGFGRGLGNLLFAAAINVAASYVASFIASAVAGFSPAQMADMNGNGPPNIGGLSTNLAIHSLLMVPIGMAMFYVPALVVLDHMSALTAMRMSFLATVKNVPAGFVYIVLIMVFSFAAAIPCGLGYLVAIPVFLASHYVSYRDVFRNAL